VNVRIGAVLCAALASAALCADQSSLAPGDPLVCFDRIDGAGSMTRVSISGMPFSTAIRV
jgi:hypothetical protein